ncbi:hypothetical protein HPB48_003569 [Haemaphysalis longicornis]|uniref:Uncharacterized protein n=1 Tax=Haemaphysalis longicornis TaxID=44386 RepID=A0A9J6GD52_HAELO|nr:hypothetical protein HPB48_003569 [Haemaphysalis longicornis]
MYNQVVPAELQKLLLVKHADKVAEVCGGLPHNEYGDAPAAAVVLTEKRKQQDGKIKATVAGRESQ